MFYDAFIYRLNEEPDSLLIPLYLQEKIILNVMCVKAVSGHFIFFLVITLLSIKVNCRPCFITRSVIAVILHAYHAEVTISVPNYFEPNDWNYAELATVVLRVNK